MNKTPIYKECNEKSKHFIYKKCKNATTGRLWWTLDIHTQFPNFPLLEGTFYELGA